jgi:hypothetical protein
MKELPAGEMEAAGKGAARGERKEGERGPAILGNFSQNGRFFPIKPKLNISLDQNTPTTNIFHKITSLQTPPTTL